MLWHSAFTLWADMKRTLFVCPWILKKTFEKNEKKNTQKTHGSILTKLLIPQLLLVLAFLTWHRIKAKITVLIWPQACYSKAISSREISNFACTCLSLCHDFSFFSNVFIIIYKYSNSITTHKLRVLCLSITLISS